MLTKMLTLSRPVAGASVLVVDDNEDMASTMACLLKQFGHDVHIARDGNQAIEIARRLQPSYVLLDLGLPGLDGFQVASAIRQEVAGRPVIIAVTGYGREDDRRRALTGGFDHYFVKPILDLRPLITLISARTVIQP
jgi:CheY-like chemotaxis protein